jgi:hypothetical protein
MGWIILEGIDRSGKSTVAELYKSQDYEVIHMSAPSKKYKEPGYSGPSYLDDILDLLMQYDGKDVVWDRSWYGEFVWPHAYGREPMLVEDDMEIIREFEERNNTQRILMVDPDTAGHWKRCVDNNEPLNQAQFRIAATLYTKLAHKYNFIPKQLSDFNVTPKNKTATPITNEQTSGSNTEIPKETSSMVGESPAPTNTNSSQDYKPLAISGLDRLEKANAISAVLSKRIIKQRGDAFDAIEGEVTNFLKGRLEDLLGSSKKSDTEFSDTEVQVLKLLCKRFIEKDAQDRSKPRR